MRTKAWKGNLNPGAPRPKVPATVAGTADFLNAYSFDADRRLLQATQEGQSGGNGVAPKGVGYSYNLDSQITGLLDFDPTTQSPHPDIAYGSLSYDAGNRLTQIDYTHAGTTTLDDMSWAYDAANRVTSFTSSVDGSASYGYDAINEVTSASYTGTNQPANESRSFDKNGNITNTGFTTGANNQLTSDGTFNYTFDHEGNRATRTRISNAPANDYLTTYAWDYRDRLTDVEYYNNSNVLTKHVHYVYDPFDHLIGTEVDPTGGGSYTTEEWYALDISGADPSAPAQPVLQFDGNGHETYRYLDGPSAAGVDAVMAEEAISTQGSAGTTNYVLADDLGSVRDLVSAASVVVDHIVYATSGVVAYESNPSVHHFNGFAGYHDDVFTGDDNADHRWYDPAVMRWESEDPLGFRGGDTNVSRYVGNSTTNAIDSTGLAGFWNWFYGNHDDNWVNGDATPPPSPRTTYTSGRMNAATGVPSDSDPTFGQRLTVAEAQAKNMAWRAGTFYATAALTIAIQFGNNANQTYHTFRHVVAAGMEQAAVQAAVAADIAANAAAINAGLNVRTIIVAGQQITYNAYKLPSGVINVGRITLP